MFANIQIQFRFEWKFWNLIGDVLAFHLNNGVKLSIDYLFRTVNYSAMGIKIITVVLYDGK